MSTFKRIFIFLSVCLIVLFSFIFPASATPNSDFIFEFTIEEPLSNQYSGYLVQPFYRPDTDSAYAGLYFWSLTPVNSTDLTTIPFVNYSFDSSKNTATISCGTGSNDGSWYFSLWYMTNDNSRIVHIGSDLIDYSNSFSFVIKASSNANDKYRYLTPKFKGLTDANPLPDNSKLFQVLFSSDSIAYNKLIDIENHFVSMLQKQDYTNSQLDYLVENFSYLLESVYNIDWALNEFVLYYWQEFANETFPVGIYEITSRLDKIIEALNPKNAEEITTYNPDTFSDLNDVDESLDQVIQNDEVLSFLDGGIDGYVDLNTPAYMLIWDIVEGAFNSHPEVLLLVFSILTLGIVALIFNR